MMKKPRLALLLISILIILNGCGKKADGMESKSENECVHKWNGMTGVCEKCEAVCQHEFNEKGRCIICKYACSHEKHDPESLKCLTCGVEVPHEYKDFICTRCGDKTQFYFSALPEKYAEPCEKQGKIVEISYDTYAYSVERIAGLPLGESIPVKKNAYVYLPYDYDENKEYNILYLMHGGGGGTGTWFALNNTELENGRVKDNVNMINHVFAEDEVDPFLIVTPSYYTYLPEDSEYASYVDAANEIEACSDLFHYELNDLIDVVESNYSTYAKGDTSKESLIASREHRAYAGLSNGSTISFDSIACHSIDTIAYIGSFSGAWTTYEKVEAGLKQFKDYEIKFWYNGEGTLDIGHELHLPLFHKLEENFPDMLNQDNFVMVDKTGYGHDMENWYIDLYNIMHVFFTK